MKSKEEILREFGCPEIPFNENVTMYYPAILSAMDEYASQQAPASTPPVSAREDGWIEINKNPNEHTEYLVRFYSEEQLQHFHEVGYFDGSWNFAYNSIEEQLSIHSATHWRPLPPPPSK